tara:strand:- start:295 stop:411 length:117 start_codon:yes stop_codon:yes gene_type:complete
MAFASSSRRTKSATHAAFASIGTRTNRSMSAAMSRFAC